MSRARSLRVGLGEELTKGSSWWTVVILGCWVRLRARGAGPCELVGRKERRAVLLGEEMMFAMLYFWVSSNLSGDIRL